MPALTAPALVAASLLVLAGAQKVLDPTMTVGALRALRIHASQWAVRVGAAVELSLGAAAVVSGAAWTWWAVAVSYAGFGVFVVAALGSGTMIGSCGCFGRDETPPHWSHVALDLALAGAAAAVALAGDPAPVESVLDHPGDGVVVTALAALATYLLYAAFVHLPRTLHAGRQARQATQAGVAVGR